MLFKSSIFLLSSGIQLIIIYQMSTSSTRQAELQGFSHPFFVREKSGSKPEFTVNLLSLTLMQLSHSIRVNWKPQITWQSYVSICLLSQCFVQLLSW